MSEQPDNKTILDILSFDAVKQETDETEIGHMCLNLYEDIEKTMNALGIHIKLDVYAGAEVYITQNPSVIRMCLNTFISYFMCKNPHLETFVISTQECQNRIWIIFHGEANGWKRDFQTQDVTQEQNFEYAMKIVEQYMQQHNICPITLFHENIWKLGMGFEFIDRRENK